MSFDGRLPLPAAACHPLDVLEMAVEELLSEEPGFAAEEEVIEQREEYDVIVSMSPSGLDIEEVYGESHFFVCGYLFSVFCIKPVAVRFQYQHVMHFCILSVNSSRRKWRRCDSECCRNYRRTW
jgi:hypothetical protein